MVSLACWDLTASVLFYRALFGTEFARYDDGAWRAEALGGSLELVDAAMETPLPVGLSGHEFGVIEPEKTVRRMGELGFTVQEEGRPAIVRDPDGREIRIVAVRTSGRG